MLSTYDLVDSNNWSGSNSMKEIILFLMDVQNKLVNFVFIYPTVRQLILVKIFNFLH